MKQKTKMASAKNVNYRFQVYLDAFPHNSSTQVFASDWYLRLFFFRFTKWAIDGDMDKSMDLEGHIVPVTWKIMRELLIYMP